MAPHRAPKILFLLAFLLTAAAGQEERNQAIARRYYETLNARGFDRLEPLVATWVVHHDAPSATGESVSAKQLAADFAALQAAFPDFAFEVREMTAAGNKVTVRYRFSGTQKGAVMGVAPTGKKAAAWAVEMLRIEEGKVREIWGTPLTETLRQALTEK
jgi:steroid delta-isomerase-like uncharacterized protein